MRLQAGEHSDGCIFENPARKLTRARLNLRLRNVTPASDLFGFWGKVASARCYRRADMTDSIYLVIPEILFGEVFARKIQTRTASTKS